MTDLLLPLNDAQRKLLELVAATEQKFDGQGPLWYWLKQQFSCDGLDADAILRSLPRVGGVGPSQRNYGLVWFDRPTCQIHGRWKS